MNAEAAASLSGPVVIDASVVVEYLVASSLTPQADTIFRAAVDRDVELWAPDLLYAESVSALRRLAARRSISPVSAESAVERLVRLPLIATGTAGLMKRAWEMRGYATPYDACYLALAEVLHAPFVTADRKLARTRSERGGPAVFLGNLGG